MVQILALAGFLWLFLISRSSLSPDPFSNAAMRLDPLAMLAHLISSQAILLGSALALVTLVLTLVFGRVWCGWLCPLGTLLDFFALRRWRRGPRPRESWRRAKHALWIAILAAAILGNLTLLVLDPLTILFRTLTSAIWPALDQFTSALERALYGLPALRDGIAAFDRVVRPAILPTDGLGARGGAWIAVLLVSVILLNAIAKRFWCRYLCPLGGLLGLVSKAALVQRRVEAGCAGCQVCARRCPTETIRPDHGYASDPAECTMCMDCLEVCRLGETHFPIRVGPARWNEYDPGRRQALIAVGAALVGAGLVQSDLTGSRPSATCIRPPGSSEEHLLRACIRCGACLRACPTGALQPALLEAGIEGLWTPVVVPRLGYCNYACNACGQVCPTQAIPPLAPEDKRLAVIGLAQIERERCIPWTEERDCIVCEEMCPLPTKAVVLEEFQGWGQSGAWVRIKRPLVLPNRCIGCGICEFKCPVAGPAAIRVERIETPAG